MQMSFSTCNVILWLWGIVKICWGCGENLFRKHGTIPGAKATPHGVSHYDGLLPAQVVEHSPANPFSKEKLGGICNIVTWEIQIHQTSCTASLRGIGWSGHGLAGPSWQGNIPGVTWSCHSLSLDDMSPHWGGEPDGHESLHCQASHGDPEWVCQRDLPMSEQEHLYQVWHQMLWGYYLPSYVSIWHRYSYFCGLSWNETFIWKSIVQVVLFRRNKFELLLDLT